MNKKDNSPKGKKMPWKCGGRGLEVSRRSQANSEGVLAGGICTGPCEECSALERACLMAEFKAPRQSWDMGKVPLSPY